MNKNKIYPRYMLFIPLIFLLFFYHSFDVWIRISIYGLSATNSKFSNLTFVGIQNLLDVISNRKLPIALVNTLIYALVKTIIVTVLGLLFAYMLNRKIKARNVLRTLYFLPAVFSALVVGLIFCAIFQTRWYY